MDRKLLLIAPTIVLLLVAAGMGYAATQLHVLGTVSETWKERSDFIAAVERGEKPLDRRQAVDLLRIALEVEARRTTAIVATRDLMIVLTAIAVVSCAVLGLGIRSVPREHWPRFRFGQAGEG